MPNKQLLSEMERKMKLSVQATAEDIATVRTGRASPAVLDKVLVEAYGSRMPIKQLANITAPEPRLLIISPWDKSVTNSIVNAITKSDLGFNPVKDGDIIRVPIPPLTEERRKEMVKLVARKAEAGKVALRNIRRDAVEELRKLEKDKEHPISEDEVRRTREEIDKIIRRYEEEIDRLHKHKEAEIMEV
ncbi:MAG: ribosome recycling factor [Abditibacteriales bacterium]|nr:ribosome recycling factor [Abditibacteriales bacterium]MDW8365081.1 ribosome recycling factor [Abditibacteriales bacterium]